MKSRILFTLIITSMMFVAANAYAAEGGVLSGWFSKKEDAKEVEVKTEVKKEVKKTTKKKTSKPKKTAKKSVKKPKKPTPPVNRLEEERYRKNPAMKELDMLRAKQQKAQMDFTKKYNKQRKKIMDKYRKKILKERKKEIEAATAKCRERVIDNMIKGEDRMGRLPY